LNRAPQYRAIRRKLALLTGLGLGLLDQCGSARHVLAEALAAVRRPNVKPSINYLAGNARLLPPDYTTLYKLRTLHRRFPTPPKPEWL
jgi:hypothetical protein